MIPGLNIFNWDSPKFSHAPNLTFSNFRFLQWWGSPKFSETSYGLTKINYYKNAFFGKGVYTLHYDQKYMVNYKVSFRILMIPVNLKY
jgi:hypothetical protein